MMNLRFTVMAIDIDESVPASMKPGHAAVYLAKEKAKAAQNQLDNEILLTADTIVALGDTIYGKPTDEYEASGMLRQLSGKDHSVVTGFCLTYGGKIHSGSDITLVTFNNLTEAEIKYYVENYQPYDKAGAYGIQEWIGTIGIKKIEGSYFNVMGLPVEKVYRLLRNLDLVELQE
jgi:septum formation protein